MYAISFRQIDTTEQGGPTRKEFIGLYGTPESGPWISCKDMDGEQARYATPAEAEARAGHALARALNIAASDAERRGAAMATALNNMLMASEDWDKLGAGSRRNFQDQARAALRLNAGK